RQAPPAPSAEQAGRNQPLPRAAQNTPTPEMHQHTRSLLSAIETETWGDSAELLLHQKIISLMAALGTSLAAVARCTCSNVSPGAISSTTSPSGFTRIHAISVAIVSTTFNPVMGSVQCGRIFGC